MSGKLIRRRPPPAPSGRGRDWNLIELLTLIVTAIGIFYVLIELAIARFDRGVDQTLSFVERFNHAEMVEARRAITSPLLEYREQLARLQNDGGMSRDQIAEFAAKIVTVNNQDAGVLQSFANVGHTGEEMLEMINQILRSNQATHFPQLIISGGITSPLHGYRLVKSSTLPAVYGMGALFLQQARVGENELARFADDIQKAWMLCDAFLKVK